MKKLLFAALVLIQIQSKAQYWDWAFSDSGTSGGSIATDFSGNIYVISSGGGASYGNYSLTCACGLWIGGAIVAKHGPSGNVIWAKQIKGINGGAVSLDKLGNIYVTGSCSSATFCGIANTIILPTLPGNFPDAFIAKYDNNGEILWVKTYGFPNSSDGGVVIKTDLIGNSYVAGQGIKSPYQGGPLSNFFLLKYDTQGNLLWSKTSNWKGNMGAGGIDIDQNDNLYISGSFSDSAFFDNITLYTNTYSSVFIAKYDKNGNVLWAKKEGTSYDSGSGISLDHKGHFYITGVHSSPSVFGNISLSPAGVFTAKYDTNGTIIWAKHANARIGIGIGSVQSGGCFVTGLMQGTASFPSGPNSVTLTSLKGPDLFVARYDSSGNFSWATLPGGGAGAPGAGNSVSALATDNNGNCFLTGGYSPVTIFGANTLTTGGLFIVKLKDSILPVITNLKVHELKKNELSIYPNPTAGFVNINYQNVEGIKNAELKINTVTGQCILSKTCKLNGNELNEQLDLSKFIKGIYFVEMVADRKKEVKMIVVD